VSAMIMAIDGKTLGGQRSGYVVISAEVLAHAMDEHNDSGAPLAPVSRPAITDKLSAVGGTVAKRVWLHHRVPLTRVHRETGWRTMTITVITLEWSDRNGQVPTRQYSADWPPQT
jgi:hypothetical protein